MILRLAALLLLASLLFSCSFNSDEVPNVTDEPTVSVSQSVQNTLPEATEGSDPPESTASPDSTAQDVTTDALETLLPLPESGTVALPSHSDDPIVLEVDGHSSFLLDLSEKSFLFFKGDGNARIYPASITKLLTALIALKYCSVDETFTVGDERALVPSDSSVAYLEVGDSLTLYELLHALLLTSGGDAAYTVAVGVGRILSGGADVTSDAALSAFVTEMNSYARMLGMTSSRFTCPDGYHDDGHYSTLYDLSLLSVAAYNNETIVGITQKSEFTCVLSDERSLTWKSSNKMLHSDSEYFLPYVNGLKTGTTDEAGCCIIATAVINGRHYIAATLGASTGAKRFEDCVALFSAISISDS